MYGKKYWFLFLLLEDVAWVGAYLCHAGEEDATDDQRHELSTVLQELNKQNAMATKMIALADGAHVAGPEGSILHMNLEKLKQISEESEEVSFPCMSGERDHGFMGLLFFLVARMKDELSPILRT